MKDKELLPIILDGLEALRFLLDKAKDNPRTQIGTLMYGLYLDDNHTTTVRERLADLWACRESIKLKLGGK